MSDQAVNISIVGKERLARIQRVLERFQNETRCECKELELLRNGLTRHVEIHFSLVRDTDASND